MELNERRTLGIIVGLILFVAVYRYASLPTSNDISLLTNNWINAVTVNKSPAEVASLFCPDGNLVGTVSQIKRTGKDIERYFDYFAKLPNLRVVSHKYNVSRITSDVHVNTAFITWMWEGLEEPIVARMTFIFRGSCIYQLHSSALPDVNKDLLKISNEL